MTDNTIALIGHRGWIGSHILTALQSRAAPENLRVLYRSTSDVGNVPKDCKTFAIDLGDHDSMVTALRGVDVLVSAVGPTGIEYQLQLAEAALAAGVKLFVPSDYSASYSKDDQSLIHVLQLKELVRRKCKEIGLPYVNIRAGYVAEFALGTTKLGINKEKNEVEFVGDEKNETLKLSSLDFIGQATAALVLENPPQSLMGRTIGLNELSVSGEDIVQALAKVHNKQPTETTLSLENVLACIQAGGIESLSAAARRNWAEGEIDIGDHVWEPPAYVKKSTLEELLSRPLDVRPPRRD